MRRDLPSKMYDWDAGFDGDGVSPGALARSRYPESVGPYWIWPVVFRLGLAYRIEQ